jgi:phosphate butyryltransferase
MCEASVCVPQLTIASFSDLRRHAQRVGPKRVAVVVADDDVALLAASDALQLRIAQPVLIGDGQKIRAKAEALNLGNLLAAAEVVSAGDPASAAVRMAQAGEVDILLKGHLRTDELLRAVLDKSAGLRIPPQPAQLRRCPGTPSGRLLSDVMLYEDVLSGAPKLVGLSDGGLNVAPNLEQKRQIVQNAVAVMHSLGLARPKIAIMCASEVVSESMPATLEAQALTKMGASGEFGEAEVYGPLALDNALLESAAKAKGITSPVAGHADCMIMPNIEAGNLLGKAVKYLGGSQCAHVVVGAKVPILIPSRVESADDKLNAIALGVIFAAWTTQNTGN